MSRGCVSRMREWHQRLEWLRSMQEEEEKRNRGVDGESFILCVRVFMFSWLATHVLRCCMTKNPVAVNWINSCIKTEDAALLVSWNERAFSVSLLGLFAISVESLSFFLHLSSLPLEAVYPLTIASCRFVAYYCHVCTTVFTLVFHSDQGCSLKCSFLPEDLLPVARESLHLLLSRVVFFFFAAKYRFVITFF